MPDEARLARVHLELVDGYRFVATFPDLPQVAEMTLDETPPLGGGVGPNPALLLAAAIGNCLAASLAFCLRRARSPVPQLSVDVQAQIVRNPAGRFRIGRVDVALSAPTTDEAITALSRCTSLFEDFCIVTESVRHGIPVNVRLSTGMAEHDRPEHASDGAAA